MSVRSMVVAMLPACFVLALSLAGCGSGDAENTADVLARNPERLKTALRECRAIIAPADDPACRTASEAWRRRFFGTHGATGMKTPPQAGQQRLVPVEPIAPTPRLAGS
jgi:conjugative transfer region protein TrbK